MLLSRRALSRRKRTRLRCHNSGRPAAIPTVPLESQPPYYPLSAQAGRIGASQSAQPAAAAAAAAVSVLKDNNIQSQPLSVPAQPTAHCDEDDDVVEMTTPSLPHPSQADQQSQPIKRARMLEPTEEEADAWWAGDDHGSLNELLPQTDKYPTLLHTIHNKRKNFQRCLRHIMDGRSCGIAHAMHYWRDIGWTEKEARDADNFLAQTNPQRKQRVKARRAMQRGTTVHNNKENEFARDLRPRP